MSCSMHATIYDPYPGCTGQGKETHTDEDRQKEYRTVYFPLQRPDGAGGSGIVSDYERSGFLTVWLQGAQ